MKGETVFESFFALKTLDFRRFCFFSVSLKASLRITVSESPIGADCFSTSFSTTSPEEKPRFGGGFADGMPAERYNLPTWVAGGVVANDFRVGSWTVRPYLNTISQNGTSVRLEPKVMDLLVCLASRPNETVSKEIIREAVWQGTFVSEDVLIRAISQLRRALQDNPRTPKIIETIPKRGYCLIANVEQGDSAPKPEQTNCEIKIQQPSSTPTLTRLCALAGVALSLALVLSFLIAGRRILQPRPASDAFREIHSIAVLPFKIAVDGGEKYLANGITTELIASLSQVRALTIVSSTSSEVYADSNKALTQIAHELGVEGIVQGTVTSSKERVRVSAELILAASGRRVWAGGFEAERESVLTQQRNMARNIAQAVSEQLPAQQYQWLTRDTTVNPRAYTDYLLGDYYEWNRLNPEGTKDAVRYLERAVAEDPGFAPAHASLSEAYFRLAPNFNASRPNVLLERSKAAAFKAAELDDSLPAGHRMLGVIHFVSWDMAAAGREFARAVELQPGDPRNLYFYAMYLSSRGRNEEAISSARRAVTLDPLNVTVQTGMAKTYLFASRYDQAITEFNRILEQNPSAEEIHSWLGVAYERKGDYARALVELAKNSDRVESDYRVSLSGYIYAREQNREKAEASVRELARMSRDISYDVSPVDFATIYAGMGDSDKAMKWLIRAYDEHDQALIGIASSPEFANLRPDPRFRDLIRRLGL